MGAREGSRVLEVGCGLGLDAISLSTIVGGAGRVVALDSSHYMVEAAKSRAKRQGLAIDFISGNASQMGLKDGSFDCARVDRTLQHIPQPEEVLAEMVRVIRSNGRIVAYEPDWGTFAVGSSDRRVARKLQDFWCDNFNCGWIGRYLYKHFQRLGLADIQISPSTMVVTDFKLAEEIFDLSKNAQRAQELDFISKSEAREWLRELKKDNLRGEFFCSYTGFLVAGRKP